MSDFYSSLVDAVEELAKRRRSLTLQQQIREQVTLPTELEILFEKPHLVMFRQVLTPLTETLLLFDLAKKFNLTPFVIEYYDDKFVSTGNQFKRGLGKLPIFKFTSPGGQDVYEYKTIVDFNSYTGKALRDVYTLHQEPLIDIHHELFFKTLDIKPIIISRDGSKWFKQFNNSHEYYEPFLKLFLRDAILFESFISNESEDGFANDVVLPSLHKIVDEFGIKPLICEIVPKDLHTPIYWDCYPTKVGEFLFEKGYS